LSGGVDPLPALASNEEANARTEGHGRKPEEQGRTDLLVTITQRISAAEAGKESGRRHDSNTQSDQRSGHHA